MSRYLPPLEFDFSPDEWLIWFRGVVPVKRMTCGDIMREFGEREESDAPDY